MSIRPRVLSTLALLSLLACDGRNPTGPAPEAAPAARVTTVSGSAQSGVVGTKLADALVVKVVDPAGGAVRGATVRWAVAAGGGTLSASTTVTDAQGEARVEWTLGTKAGEKTVGAAVGGLAATFAATARPGAPARVERVKGDGQSAPERTLLTDSLAVRVLDAYDNPVPGVEVAWVAAAGGGSLAPDTCTTDDAGIARTRWSVGSAGANAAAATVEGLAAVGFSATASGATGAAAVIEKSAGDAQTGTVGAALARRLAARVLDSAGAVVAGASVVWSVTEGGGSITPGLAVTDADGIASATWTMGTAAGSQRASATAAGRSLSFTATAAAGAPSRLEHLAGDGQSGAAGAALADSLAVRVSDAHGNPVPGIALTWSIAGGGGSVSPAASTTGATGVARTRFTLGGTAGSHSASASAPGIFPVSFSATALPAGASLLEKVSGDAQSGTVAAALPAPLVVRVTDAHGNGVSGVSVSWQVTAGGGSLSAASATTGADGRTQVTWTPGSAAGANGATATAVGATVTFAATGTVGPRAKLVKLSGDGQTAHPGHALAQPVVVRVTDAHDNPISGAAVAWAVASGGGSVAPASGTTDATGAASAVWTLGSGSGQATLTAGVSGLPAATFTAATATPATVAKASGDAQSGAVGTKLPTALVVRVTDSSGNAMAGVSVGWAVGSGGGALSASGSATDGQGRAQVEWTLGAAPGPQTVVATAGSLTATFTATGTAGAAAAIQKVSGDAQSASVGAALSAPLVVKVVDGYGNAVAGATVAWQVTGGGGSPSQTSTTTASDGLAQATWTLGTTAGAQSATASAAGQSVTFAATASAGAAAAIERIGGDGQTGTVGAALADPLVVRVLDASGNPVSGAAVTWSVSSGGGSLAGGATTGADGRASATWTLGTATGANGVTATAAGDSVTFAATAEAGSASAVVKVGGDAQSDTAGTVLPSPVVVRVTDQYGNPRSGATVTWTVDGGGGSTTPASSTTGSDGQTQTSWTLGGAAGANSLTASIGGGASAAFTATGTPPDLSAPVVAAFSFTPTSVTGGGSRQITFTMNVTDTGTGADSVVVRVVSPSRAESRSCTTTTPASGDPNSGTFSCSATIPAAAEVGVWTVDYVMADDGVNNRTYYYTADLQAASFPTDLTVVN